MSCRVIFSPIIDWGMDKTCVMENLSMFFFICVDILSESREIQTLVISVGNTKKCHLI